MQQITEPVYVGVDADSLLAQFNQADRRRTQQRRAAGRRSASHHSPLTEDLEARIALGGHEAVTLRSSLVA